MKNRICRAAGILLSLVVLVSVGLAYPAGVSAAGSGPDDALLLTNEWAQLGAGKSQWYSFYYAGDGSQIHIQLQVEPEDSMEFAVWTPEQICAGGWASTSSPSDAVRLTRMRQAHSCGRAASMRAAPTTRCSRTTVVMPERATTASK